MSIGLDHLMWGAASLEEGIEEAKRLFGIAPVPGGVHPGLGTRNALLSLGEAVYLEVIAPDPGQTLSGTLGGRLATLSAPGLITWAAASPDLERVKAVATARSLTARGPVPTERRAPDGSLLRWELLFLGGHPYGSLVPFFIDWRDTPHPAGSNPVGGRLRHLEIRSPEAAGLNDLFQALDLQVPVDTAAEPGLGAVIETAAGEVRLDSAPAADGWSL